MYTIYNNRIYLILLLILFAGCTSDRKRCDITESYFHGEWTAIGQGTPGLKIFVFSDKNTVFPNECPKRGYKLTILNSSELPNDDSCLYIRMSPHNKKPGESSYEEHGRSVIYKLLKIDNDFSLMIGNYYGKSTEESLEMVNLENFNVLIYWDKINRKVYCPVLDRHCDEK